MKNHLRQNRGSALIAITIISALMIASATGYIMWLQQSAKATVHRSTSRRALDQAEFGVDSAMVKLREPGYLLYGSSKTLSVPFESGRMDLLMTRQNSIDNNVVQVVATAYQYTGGGAEVDPQNTSMHAQKASVGAKIRMNYIGDYFAIVPDSLKVAYGSDLGAGSVYSRNIEFERGSTFPPTRVQKAYYVESVSPADYLTFVDFTDDANFPAAMQLSSTPNLVYLNDATKSFYQGRAVDWTPGLGHPLTGSQPAPTNNVYFCGGDLHIGTPTEELTVDGYWVIYTTGNVYIHNSIQVNSNSWIGILAHGGITIAADAPSPITLHGNFVTDGAIRSELPARPAGQLTFYGGFLAHEGADFSTVWQGNRTYTYVRESNPLLLLPNFTELLETHIIRGKFSR